VRLELPDGKSTTVHVAPGQQKTAAVASSVTHSGRVAALVGAGAAALLGLVLLVGTGLGGRRRRRAHARG
jgi:hypothetical protein